MVFYTGHGDKGRTTLFGRAKKISKSSPKIEALGALDELVSFLGLCKVKAADLEVQLPSPSGDSVSNLLNGAQNDLFAIQAEMAGAEKGLKKGRIKEMEKLIEEIGKKLPKIKNFVVPGGSELSALLDCARAVARRAERSAVALGNKEKVRPDILAYLNRLSSLLFVLARLSNKNRGIKELLWNL